MSYKIVFLNEKLIDDLEELGKSEPKSYQKLIKLLEELKEHPKTGTGKPKQLSYNRSGQWSRKITDKHRLIYTIEEVKKVIIISILGHYGEK